MPRIPEEQLTLPSLYLMDNTLDKTILTSDLKEGLVAIFRPAEEGTEIAQGRNDTLFTQKVKNLKSRDTLENLGYAICKKNQAGARSGSFTLTDIREKYLYENKQRSTRLRKFYADKG